MPIDVLSPHSGQPVKVRDADVGRAIRDADGKVFYVVARDDGDGHYAARTRAGSPAEQQRYDQLRANPPAPEPASSTPEPTTATTAHGSPGSVYDATGHARSRPGLRIVIAVLLILVLAAAIVLGLVALVSDDAQTPVDPDVPQTPNTSPEPTAVPEPHTVAPPAPTSPASRWVLARLAGPPGAVQIGAYPLTDPADMQSVRPFILPLTPDCPWPAAA